MTERPPLPSGAAARLAAVVMPPLIARLERDARGYPIPKFVDRRADVDGKPDFRVMDPAHLMACVRKKLCWVCGCTMGRNMAFAIGPMCAVNRISSEPPSHLACVQYAAKVCPFLAVPEMRRIDHNMPAAAVPPPGVALARNPGVSCLWVVRSYRPFRVDRGILFEIGEPETVEWWCRGAPASRAAVLASLDSGLPALEAIADAEGPEAQGELSIAYGRALAFLPAP